MKNKEIEIQVNIEKREALEEFLKENAEFIGEKSQKDDYFSPPHRDFTEIRPIKEWLRVREAGDKAYLNYKNWHYNEAGKSYFCDEYETELKDAGQIRKILEVLDFNHLVTVDKRRRSWRYQDYEVVLDSVEGLGDFVEIEYKGGSDVDPQQETEKMVRFLKERGCGKIKRNYVGYPFQLLFPKEVKYEEL